MGACPGAAGTGGKLAQTRRVGALAWPGMQAGPQPPGTVSFRGWGWGAGGSKNHLIKITRHLY